MPGDSNNLYFSIFWLLSMISKSIVCADRVQFYQASPTIRLSNLVASEVFYAGLVVPESTCLKLCYIRDCAIASYNQSGRCLLIGLINAYSLPELNSSIFGRLVGTEMGEKVWTTIDLDQRFLGMQLKEVWIFYNSSVGRLGSVQTAMINVTGCYRIEASGAKGGSNFPNVDGQWDGGDGAFVAGDFNLTAGTELSIVVGQRGGNATQNIMAGSGGGGGSYVFRSSDRMLYVAAGGGGGGGRVSPGIPGQQVGNGTNSYFQTSSYLSLVGIGGVNGSSGGTVKNFTSPVGNHGGPGAGWILAPNDTRRDSQCGDWGSGPWAGFVGGAGGVLNGGAVGGFGGGGGGGQSLGASGGGGGFSGGGAGLGTHMSGGGGGSKCTGGSCVMRTGGGTGGIEGQGIVSIRLTRVGSCN